MKCSVCRVQSRAAAVVVTFPEWEGGPSLGVCSRCLSTATAAWAAIGVQMATRGAPVAAPQAERGAAAGVSGAI